MNSLVNGTGKDVTSEDPGPANFERAIISSGYGKFNYLLLLALLPASFSSIFSSSAISYVLPSAQCDLGLTMFDKGLLNSMTFAGMISTSFFWGFMTDTYGRKKIMFYGYMVTGVLSLASCFSHKSWLLIFFKFLDGVTISGPYAALMSYLAEVHNETNRSRTYMWLGVFFSLGNISLPCIAWLIIPQKWNMNLLGKMVEISSWRVFLAICSLPEFLACIAMFAFPESPRFLLLKGRREEALEVFKRIYAVNTGKDPDTYPIKDLEEEFDCSEATTDTIRDKAVLNARVFINSIVIATTGVVGYTLAGSLITVVGKKKLIATCFMVAAACCGSLYWAQNTDSILGLSSVFVAMSSIGGACVLNIIVDNFPTCLRTMAVSLVMMVGRLGAVIGNLLFPVLFKLSCIGPFVLIGSASLVSALLVSVLPRKYSETDKSKNVI
ncbi:synaptic vesicle glycoprotein 2C isoform X2 [Lasioglossum baleicum]|uniref:synaptic vesicle glycoprotein 2C isoform X2 n=1 Tax=Lasioglossum baleicum TaxID=434251 RepID=UPI003FCDAD78